MLIAFDTFFDFLIVSYVTSYNWFHQIALWTWTLCLNIWFPSRFRVFFSETFSETSKVVNASTPLVYLLIWLNGAGVHCKVARNRKVSINCYRMTQVESHSLIAVFIRWKGIILSLLLFFITTFGQPIEFIHDIRFIESTN